MRTASAALKQLVQAPEDAYARERTLARLVLGRAEWADGDAAAAREHIELALTTLGPEAAALRIEALDTLASALQASGEFEAAERALTEAVTLARGLGEAPESRRTLSCCLDELGRVMRERGKLEEALALFQEALLLDRQQLADNGETPQALLDLSISLNQVGDVARQRGNLDEALAAFQESLVIRRRLASAAETPTALRNVAVSLNQIGNVAHQRGNLDAALAAFHEALTLCRRLLANFGETPEALRALSVSLERVGDVARERGNLDEALAAFKESLAIRRRLLADFGESPQALRDLVVALNHLGNVARRRLRQVVRCLRDRGETDGAAALQQELDALSVDG